MPTHRSDEGAFTLRPIGVARTPHRDRFLTPRQPGGEGRSSAPSRVVLDASLNLPAALRDLAGFERIWVISWFHGVDGWKPLVLPPRGPRVKRGVFATRSPHRPNPLGLSLVQLLDVRGRTLVVSDLDLLDGTPVLDVKPYLPSHEAWPEARGGWLDAALAEDLAPPPFAVTWSPTAQADAAWLRDAHGIDLTAVAARVLGRDPTAHPYRRVSEAADGARVLAVKSWRVRFRVEGAAVTVASVESGYGPAALRDAPLGSLEDDAAHRAFVTRARGPLGDGR